MEVGELSAEDQAFFDNRGAPPPPPAEGGLLNQQPGAQPEPQAEPEVPDEEDAKDEDGKVKTVPHQALHEAKLQARRERDARRKAERDFAEFKGRMEGRFEALMARVSGDGPAKPEAKPDPEPDRQQDYTAWLEWKLRENDRWRQQQDQRGQQEQQVAQQHQGEQRLIEAYQAAADEFRGEQKDFDEAYDFVVAHRRSMLKALGYRPGHVESIINYEEKGLVQSAFADRQNPAERIYRAALALGYKPGQKPGAAIETIARGQQQRSLGGVPGTGGGKSMAQTILNMGDDEFAKLAENPRAWRKAMGGQ